MPVEPRDRPAISEMRRRLRRAASGQRRNMLVSDLQLVSGVAFTAIFLVGNGALATSVVASASQNEVAYESLRALAALGNTLMNVMGVRMAGIFVLATSTLGLTTGVLPRWFSLLGYAFGAVLMVSPILEPSFTLAFPTWVVVLSLMLLSHLANVPDDQLPGFAGRYMDEAEETQAPVIAD